ncbi:MAG: purine-nucleoside phosphorylase [Oscillospiraceae bacterium]
MMETYTYQQYQQSAAALADRLGDFRPEVSADSGLRPGFAGRPGGAATGCPLRAGTPYEALHCAGPQGAVCLWAALGRNVAVMQGRLHTYEGWSFADVSYPVRVLRLLGAKTLLVTNAAGAVNTAFSAGDIMMITDHIKLFGVSPLCGANLDEFGPRFPDVSAVYTPALRKAAREAAQALEIPLREGVYMYFPGPQFETPAEVRMARILGADAVGMSTVPETIVAAHCGMQVLGFTLCTNMAAGVLDQPLSGEEVLEAAEAARPRFTSLVKACLERV